MRILVLSFPLPEFIPDRDQEAGVLSQIIHHGLMPGAKGLPDIIPTPMFISPPVLWALLR